MITIRLYSLNVDLIWEGIILFINKSDYFHHAVRILEVKKKPYRLAK